MDILSIKTLACIAETGSFSAAADALNVSQPAISKRVHKLEEELNCRLVERHGRSAKLTGAGKLLISSTNTLVKQLETVKHTIAALNDEISGELNIITSHHIGMHRLPQFLKQYCDNYPSVKIHLSFADSEAAYNQLSEGDDDFALVTLGKHHQGALISEPLWHDPLVIMVAKTHPFASRSSVTLQQLSDEQAVLPGMETYTGRIVKQLFDEKGLSLKANMATNYLETIKMMVSVGLGWTMLPASMADDTVSKLSVEGISASRTLGIIQRASYQATPAAKAFFALLNGTITTEQN